MNVAAFEWSDLGTTDLAELIFCLQKICDYLVTHSLHRAEPFLSS
jgi:hypothetical protein